MRRRHLLMVPAMVVVFLLVACIVMALAPPPPEEGFEQSYAGPGIKTSDLPVADVATAFVPTKEPVMCKTGPCTFGLLRLAAASGGSDGAATFTLSTHLAGAVYKLTYKGREFVNPVAIVGASMQTALVYDGDWSFNPTEGGCGECDSFTGKSSSKMVALRASDTAVYTSVQAANFFPAGKELKWGKKSTAPSIVSETTISKRIEFVGDVAHYTVAVRIPDQKHSACLLEVLCVWTPRENCETMHILSNGTWKVAPDDDPIRRKPVLYWMDAPNQPKTSGLVMCGRDESAAFGIRLVDHPKGFAWESPRYGTPLSIPAWRKWSVTHRINPSKNTAFKIPGGEYTWKFHMYFGTLQSVKQRLARDVVA